MVYAYIRVSTAEQSGSSQEFEIRNWALKQGVSIGTWITESVSGTLPPEKRKLGKLLRNETGRPAGLYGDLPPRAEHADDHVDPQ